MAIAVMEPLCVWQLVLVTCLLVIPILYQTSKQFKYYVKIAVYFLCSLFIGCGVIICSLRRPRNPKNHFVVSFSVRAFLSDLLGIELIVREEERLKKDEPFIIVLNHQSSLDMIPLFRIWPDNCVSVAKKELIWTTGTFGPGAWLCGTVYINRLNSESARKTIEETATLIKNRRLKIAIFPEGTRNHSGSMLPFKKGAFHLAVQAQVPIVPVVISSYKHFYSKKEKIFDEGRVIVEILPPIPTTGLTSADVTSLTEKTRSIMLECFQKISEEATARK
ncbi:unnamed protein product [Candidula unifasciata]|uniref:1-acyl-sn-glycerol-3-phosphate acyltransferase n=1 Tax=Candidula unifasciata TaxID=100452 RepID=A0A8S3ZZY9_9EUPU|nr:unnamed protein product [Candidula unifasciata]